MKSKYWLAAAILSLSLANAMAADDASAPAAASDTTAAPAAAAPAAAPAAPAAAPTAPAAAAQPASAGTGTIIFFRPRKFLGAAIGFIVREGTTELGRLRNGNFFSVQVPAGVHHYVVHSEAKDELAVDVEAGETYYVQGAVGVGLLAGRPNISPSDAASYEAVKDKLSPSAPLSGDKSGK